MYAGKIFAPLITGALPSDADRKMMMLPDGEIRIYGNSCHPQTVSAGEVTPVVMKSVDNGLNWHTEPVTHLTPGATVRSPWSGTWITVCDYAGIHVPKHKICAADRILEQEKEPGIYFFRGESPDGPFTVRRIFDKPCQIQRQPLALRNRKRWLVPYQYRESDARYYWGVLLSDDDGENWRKVDLGPQPIPGVLPGHGGLRWIHCGLEPVVAEYDDGRLHALFRCAHDEHYEAFSPDGGETWCEPVPSRFYAVATMPGLYHLSGGRMLAVWNNTVPLAEVDHLTQYGGNDPDIINGVWEDVFTNRDALHAAISADGGRTWRGFREILLNPARNDSDFRSVIFPDVDGLDKSVHQNQVLELADGKILVSAGQNPLCRKVVIFDPDWLLETEREERFDHGLQNISHHQFFKGVVGGRRQPDGIGHCAYNRRPGAALMPHPDRLDREVLLIGHHPDERLVSSQEGAVWNFPAAPSGKVTIRLRQCSGSAGCRFILTDRWINPSDPMAESYAVFSVKLDQAGKVAPAAAALAADTWHDLELVWDLREEICRIFCNGNILAEVPRLRKTPNDISYLHIQTAASAADPHGVMFECFRKE